MSTKTELCVGRLQKTVDSLRDEGIDPMLIVAALADVALKAADDGRIMRLNAQVTSQSMVWFWYPQQLPNMMRWWPISNSGRRTPWTARRRCRSGFAKRSHRRIAACFRPRPKLSTEFLQDQIHQFLRRGATQILVGYRCRHSGHLRIIEPCG